MQQSKIRFLGGAGAVTGSNFLLDTGGAKFLVDCGLQQAEHTCEDSNWNPFAFEPSEIDTLVVTHAHIDHVGRIPLLVKRGFKGRIISTEATKAIAEPLLRDSMELLEAEARRCNTDILYTNQDVSRAFEHWESIPYHQKITLKDDVELELLNSGHILGSALVKFTRGERSIVFTGDLGGGNSPLLSACEEPQGVNYLVMESVYGNRVRTHAEDALNDTEHNRSELEDIIEATAARGGTLLIPAFSTERTQDLLFEIRELMVQKKVPSMPVYIDSPLAEKITESFLAYPKYFSDPIRARIEAGEKIFNFPEAHFVSDMDASRKADEAPSPKILLAGSGMSNGGRVRGHEAHILPDPKSTLLIVGYQVAGSLGRRLVEGAKSIDIHKEHIAVRAKIETIYGYSAHMDGQQLVEFVNQAREKLEQVFVVMGEPLASSTLTQRLRDYLGVKALAPNAGDEAEINL